MTPRWSWDFEDDRKPAEKAGRPAPQPLPQAPLSEVDRTQLRRRRGVAVVVALLIVVAGIAALSSSHHAPATGSGAPTGRATHRRPEPAPVDSRAQGEAAVRSVLAYTPFVRQGGARGRDVALTFDDGPGPYTPQVLDVLERRHAPATFFEVGRLMRYFGAATERQIADGDWIGDHTENHSPLARLSAHDQREELFEQIARVELLDGPRPVLFRPPYGSFNATTMRVLRSMHLLMVLWSVDTQDYRRPGVSVIAGRALLGVQPGAIILMHDGGGNRAQTVAALPAIIKGVRARGYRLVTVPQLLRDDPPPHGLPLPPSLAGGLTPP